MQRGRGRAIPRRSTPSRCWRWCGAPRGGWTKPNGCCARRSRRRRNGTGPMTISRGCCSSRVAPARPNRSAAQASPPIPPTPMRTRSWAGCFPGATRWSRARRICARRSRLPGGIPSWSPTSAATWGGRGMSQRRRPCCAKRLRPTRTRFARAPGSPSCSSARGGSTRRVSCSTPPSRWRRGRGATSLCSVPPCWREPIDGARAGAA